MWRISLQLLCYSMRGSEGEWDKPAKSPSRSMNCACSTQIAVRQNKPQQSKLLWWRFLNFRILLSLTPYFGIYSLKWAPKILLFLLLKSRLQQIRFALYSYQFLKIRWGCSKTTVRVLNRMHSWMYTWETYLVGRKVRHTLKHFYDFTATAFGARTRRERSRRIW